MARRHRMTPFARFFIFLIFIAPVAYFGVTYYKGEDPIAQVKQLLNIEESPNVSNQEAETTPEKIPVKQPETKQPTTPKNTNTNSQKATSELQQKLRYQVEKNDELREEIKQLEEKVWQLEQENKRLKAARNAPINNTINN